MKWKKAYKILSATVTFLIVGDDVTTAAGDSKSFFQQIRINKDLPEEGQIRVAIHEVLEYGNDELELELKHPQIAGCTAVIYSFLMDNDLLRRK